MKSEIEFEVKDTEFWLGIDLTGWALPLFITWGVYPEWFFFHIAHTLNCAFYLWRVFVKRWDPLPGQGGCVPLAKQQALLGWLHCVRQQSDQSDRGRLPVRRRLLIHLPSFL